MKNSILAAAGCAYGVASRLAIVADGQGDTPARAAVRAAIFE